MESAHSANGALPGPRGTGMHSRRIVLIGAALIALVHPLRLSAQPDRSGPPKMGPPPVLTLPPIGHLALSNGIKVLLLEKHTVPLVQVNLVVRAGALMDPDGKAGLASMTASMLTEGAGGRNALEFDDAVDFLGADITATAGFSVMGIALHTPLAKLDSALSLLADVARRPRFPVEELERMRKERLTALIQWRAEPRMLASVLFSVLGLFLLLSSTWWLLASSLLVAGCEVVVTMDDAGTELPGAQ